MLSSSDRKDVREGYWFGLRWTVVVTITVLVLVAVIGIAVWAFGVGTSDVKGRGDAIKQRNSGTNRVFAQQHFEELNTAIEKDVANIKAAQSAFKLNKSAANEANVTGTIQICNADVADYNASARKYLERDFRASDLPAHIDLAVCNGD